ncbi:MAG: tyrosine--tRNA ligase [Candidatus Moraniibacteriota bacterium]
MSEVITDEKKIDEVLERGVDDIYSDKKKLREILISGRKLRIYCGFDPSATALHLGNAIQIAKLAQFQKLGHEIVFLIGDFTGMIGDPTDKTAARQKLTREEVLQNSKDFQRQASAWLEFEGNNPARVEYNSKWQDKLTFRDLIEISSEFTVQQMIQRDMFQKRLEEEKAIYLHEFLYPLAQGYDSVALDVDLEIGGSDQMFNMMRGRDLQKAINGKEKFVLIQKLLEDDKGNKMSKSEGNVVWLNDDYINMYAKVMSWADGLIAPGFEVCTNVSLDEAQKIKRQLEKEEINPRDLKMKLAFEITKIYHGKENAEKAQEDFVNKFQRKGSKFNIDAVVAESPVLKIKESDTLVEILSDNNLAQSKSDARRKIKQGGVSIDGKKIDLNDQISKDWDGKILKVGKKDFRKIEIE